MYSTEYRDYKIESDVYCNKVIKPLGKGSVHLSLRGSFTSEREACLAIDSYESTKKVKKNGKTK